MRFVIDTKQMRPACALLQAAFKGDYRRMHLFPADSWLVAPTPDMRMLEGTDAEWAQFAARLEERFPRPARWSAS